MVALKAVGLDDKFLVHKSVKFHVVDDPLVVATAAIVKLGVLPAAALANWYGSGRPRARSTHLGARIRDTAARTTRLSSGASEAAHTPQG